MYHLNHLVRIGGQHETMDDARHALNRAKVNPLGRRRASSELENSPKEYLPISKLHAVGVLMSLEVPSEKVSFQQAVLAIFSLSSTQLENWLYNIDNPITMFET